MQSAHTFQAGGPGRPGTGRPGLILFDFDGTLYRGDDPYRFYAGELARRLGTSESRSRYLARVEAHLDGREDVAAGDNWEAMVELARLYLHEGPDVPLPPAAVAEAFLTTRRFMMEPGCRLEVPEGLGTFLARARELGVVLAVASNSPPEASVPLLEKLGLLSRFDAVRPSCQKPDGLVPFAQELLSDHGIGPTRVVSVGDNYKNDVRPAAAAGWRTAHVSPRGHFPGPADLEVRTLEGALPALWAWVSEWAAAPAAGAAIS